MELEIDQELATVTIRMEALVLPFDVPRRAFSARRFASGTIAPSMYITVTSGASQVGGCIVGVKNGKRRVGKEGTS